MSAAATPWAFRAVRLFRGHVTVDDLNPRRPASNGRSGEPSPGYGEAGTSPCLRGSC